VVRDDTKNTWMYLPDNILVQGRLENGAVVNAYTACIRTTAAAIVGDLRQGGHAVDDWRGEAAGAQRSSGRHKGDKATRVARAGAIQVGAEAVRNDGPPMKSPDGKFAEAIRTGSTIEPDFDHAVAATVCWIPSSALHRRGNGRKLYCKSIA